ncbi:protein phosphatase 2C domain-containing protein [Acidiphilium sp. AL]|uniref:Protein phosphatase 2C domain-containing protein n=1 Tax=Acidiphilium iwatense TaxID=768198 RepID=A0ABS9E4B6_9PROT|nr:MULTISPECIES: protein phosphatase 2C domain-containing protein [Acidiphilium]MCF3948492.1 protein phosphatase 2C domain-containing protein [Acidiphilium iwatense]MCU4161241.1 protein phosphatase 2C domain-containing protein [Acidiphilium sp. AL]
MIPTVKSWAQTHVGTVRRHNEDAYLARPDLGLWAVADGAGGHQSGDLASGMIVAALDRLEPGLTAAELLARVRMAIAEVHAVLQAEAATRGPGAMIASTVVVLVLRDTHFACLWAGDSRAYLLRDGELTQISRDHSLVQALVDDGALSAEAAEHHPQANVITRAVGADHSVLELDKAIGETMPGDRFLLCSDGLSKTLPDAEIAALLGSPDGVPPTELLIAAALARHVNDNVTAVTVGVV